VRQTNHSFALDDALRRQEEAVLSAVLSASKPGTVIVSQAAARFLRDRVQLKAFAAGGDVESAFQLQTTQQTPDRLGRVSSIPFVGRRQERDLLECIFERVRAGRAQVVGVVGESGMGKSRLVQEFAHRLTDSQHSHRWFRVVPYGPRLADLTIAEVLRQAWQIAHDDSTETIVMKVRSGLDRLGMSAELWAPPILTVFGIRGQRAIASASPEELKKRLFDALRRVALEMSKQQPLVIEVADLNLFGRTSLEFVSYFVENLPGSRILLLTTYGPQYRLPWVAKSYVTQMALPPLGREESLALLHSVLLPGEGSARFVEPILERAEGNPFFLEEFARNVSAHDARTELPLPPSVRVLIEARMDHLEDKARGFLYQAAAIGRRMPAERLKQICEEPVLSDSIAAWKRLELIHEDIEDGEKVYVFRDALVWEVARHAGVGRPLGPF
jgi:predicted ATPase